MIQLPVPFVVTADCMETKNITTMKTDSSMSASAMAENQIEVGTYCGQDQAAFVELVKNELPMMQQVMQGWLYSRSFLFETWRFVLNV